MPIQYTSIYTDPGGVSHFRDNLIPLQETVLSALIPPLGASPVQTASSCYFLTFPPGMDIDWHPAPRRLYHFFLAGECDVKVSDGETRKFQAGDIVLAEDTSGAGHTTKNSSSQTTLMAVVALSE